MWGSRADAALCRSPPRVCAIESDRVATRTVEAVAEACTMVPPIRVPCRGIKTDTLSAQSGGGEVPADQLVPQLYDDAAALMPDDEVEVASS